MVLAILLTVTGILGILYTIILQFLNPSPFLDAITSFTNIWAFAGFILLYAAHNLYRGKKPALFRFTKNIKKPVIFLCLALAVSCSINLVLCLHPYHEPEDDSYDYLLLLGGGITKDGTLVIPVRNRIEVAADWLTLHPETKCIVTGGTLDHLEYAESPAIKAALVERGIEADRIIEEDQALDTIDNIAYSAECMSKDADLSILQLLEKPVVIVTSRFHMNRALFIAKRSGFTKAAGLAAKTPVLYIPHDYLREICAWVKLELRILFTGKPRLLQPQQ